MPSKPVSCGWLIHIAKFSCQLELCPSPIPTPQTSPLTNHHRFFNLICPASVVPVKRSRLHLIGADLSLSQLILKPQWSNSHGFLMKKYHMNSSMVFASLWDFIIRPPLYFPLHSYVPRSHRIAHEAPRAQKLFQLKVSNASTILPQDNIVKSTTATAPLLIQILF